MPIRHNSSYNHCVSVSLQNLSLTYTPVHPEQLQAGVRGWVGEGQFLFLYFVFVLYNTTMSVLYTISLCMTIILLLCLLYC